ncbi:MAG TPA: stage V sporulation protein AD [Candidatus Pullilachnospira intestinigallinarum]|nr:stage V sporulation protein AD [Candidatus Pullilachnospira intestinigallinarum]
MGAADVLGKQSLVFREPVFIQGWGSVVGKKEGEGPMGACFDQIEEDPALGAENWEEAESRLQILAAKQAVEHAGLSMEEIRMIFAGDLLAQSIASSFGIGQLDRPVYGLFGACSTMGEALSLAAVAVAAGAGTHVLALTSSHFATAEKEFRFPLEYGSQRPLSASWTVTGSGACVVGSRPGQVKITGITTGKITDYGLKDSQNMGACMAPAACQTISAHLRDFSRSPEDYDRIITGDLGYVGQQILLDLMEEEGFRIGKVHEDCGIRIFDRETQDTHAGGSGCGCSASVLAGWILPKIAAGEWKRVLFVPTGALMSRMSFYEGNSVPGIAQAVVLETVQEN